MDTQVMTTVEAQEVTLLPRNGRHPKIKSVDRPNKDVDGRPPRNRQHVAGTPRPLVQVLNELYGRISAFAPTHLCGAGDETLAEAKALTRLVAEARSLAWDLKVQMGG